MRGNFSPISWDGPTQALQSFRTLVSTENVAHCWVHKNALKYMALPLTHIYVVNCVHKVTLIPKSVICTKFNSIWQITGISHSFRTRHCGWIASGCVRHVGISFSVGAFEFSNDGPCASFLLCAIGAEVSRRVNPNVLDMNFNWDLGRNSRRNTMAWWCFELSCPETVIIP